MESHRGNRRKLHDQMMAMRRHQHHACTKLRASEPDELEPTISDRGAFLLEAFREESRIFEEREMWKHLSHDSREEAGLTMPICTSQLK